MPQTSWSQQNASPFNDDHVQKYASLQDSLTTPVHVEWSLLDHVFWGSLVNICDNKSQPDSHISSPLDGSLLAEGSADFAPLLGEQDIQDSVSLNQLYEWDQIPLLTHDGDVYLGAVVGGILPTPQSDSFPLSSYSPEPINSTDNQDSYCPGYATTCHSNEYTCWISDIPAWSGQTIDQFVQSPHVMTESCAPINPMPPFITNKNYNSFTTQPQVEARAELEAQNQSPVPSSLPSSGDLPLSLPPSPVVPPRTRTKIRREKRSVTNNQVVQHALCLWNNCSAFITTDKRSVGKHMRGHLRALGLLPITSDYIASEARRIHCLWRDEIPCPYSDRCQSEALARLNARKTWQYDRSATRDSTDLYRQPHSNRGHDVDVELSSDCDGALLSVHSLINHICAKHLFSLAATCSDCGEQFTRTDAHLRHQREVHKGRQRRR